MEIELNVQSEYIPRRTDERPALPPEDFPFALAEELRVSPEEWTRFLNAVYPAVNYVVNPAVKKINWKEGF